MFNRLLLRVRPPVPNLPGRIALAVSCGLALSMTASAAPKTHAPASVPLVGPDRDFRSALDEGRPDVLLAPEVRTQIESTAPGLLGRAHLADGDAKSACDVFQRDHDANAKRAAAVSLSLARCRTALKQTRQAAAAWTEVLGHPTLGRDPILLADALHALFRTSERSKWVQTAIAGERAVLEIAAPNATDKREAFARVLASLHEAASREGATASAETRPAFVAGAARALDRLYLEFGETTAAKTTLALPVARKLAKHRDKKKAVARARALSRRHDNKAIVKTLARHMPKARDTSEGACEIRYIVGKAQRKMRRYKGARKNLDYVANKCAGDWQKRARYMTARVASFQGAKDAVKVFDAFVAAYPKDTLADDVLLWKAEHLALRRQKKTAEKVYEELIAAHPSGDMVHTARFDLALSRARRGDVTGARAALDELARHAIDRNILVADRALYWRARLAVFPNVDEWTQTGDVKARDAGTKALLELARARPASFYGHLARLVVESISPDATSALPPVPTRASLDANVKLRVGPALAKNSNFLEAVSLVQAGYDDTAVMLLDAIDRKALVDMDVLSLTALYTNAGAHAESHQVMRERGAAVPRGRPSKKTLPLWVLSFPLAHENAITLATAATGLPTEVFFGLAREESAFDAAVVSWAGAVGLSQLMMFTAKEEAGLLKKPTPSVDDLRNPILNARLGANHLMRRQSLGHPMLAIAAYNAGPGNVNKWTKRQKGPIDAWVESIPIAQTRGYVVKVTGSWVVYSLLAGKAAPTFSLALPGKRPPKKRALKGKPMVDKRVLKKAKAKLPPPKKK